jgi:SOS response regulatory protein OraA/RecX
VSEETPGRVTISSPRGTRRVRAVSIDEVELRRTSADVLRTAGIHDGDTWAETDVNRMIDAAEPEAAMNRSLRLLGHRERSTTELSGRLAEDGYPDPVIDSVTTRLADYGYLDDSRFAEEYVRTKRSSGWGRRRIARGLSERGVDPEISSQLLDSHLPEASEIDRACEAIDVLDVSDRKGLAKGLRRLVSRGFSYEVARAALNRRQEDARDLG